MSMLAGIKLKIVLQKHNKIKKTCDQTRPTRHPRLASRIYLFIYWLSVQRENLPSNLVSLSEFFLAREFRAVVLPLPYTLADWRIETIVAGVVP